MWHSVAAIKQIFAGDVDIEPGHRVEVLEVLLGHERDRDLEDRQLVLLDQVEQEVERTLEHVEGDLIGASIVTATRTRRANSVVHVLRRRTVAGIDENPRELRDQQRPRSRERAEPRELVELVAIAVRREALGDVTAIERRRRHRLKKNSTKFVSVREHQDRADVGEVRERRVHVLVITPRASRSRGSAASSVPSRTFIAGPAIATRIDAVDIEMPRRIIASAAIARACPSRSCRRP